MKRIKRRQTIGEEIANAVSHGIMALFGIFILVFCLIKSDYQPNKIAGAIVYGMSTVALFTISCLYHALTNETAKSKVFKRLDHISIYLLIGGTYTPILLNLSTMQGTIGGTALTIG
jgi:hemolysin III